MPKYARARRGYIFLCACTYEYVDVGVGVRVSELVCQIFLVLAPWTHTRTHTNTHTYQQMFHYHLSTKACANLVRVECQARPCIATTRKELEASRTRTDRICLSCHTQDSTRKSQLYRTYIQQIRSTTPTGAGCHRRELQHHPQPTLMRRRNCTQVPRQGNEKGLRQAWGVKSSATLL